MGRVFREIQCTPSECLLLVALADHAHDDGTSVYPSVAYLCWKTGLSKRFVRERISYWRKYNVLLAIDEERGRGKTVEYQLCVDSLPRKDSYTGSPSGSARAKRARMARGKSA